MALRMVFHKNERLKSRNSGVSFGIKHQYLIRLRPPMTRVVVAPGSGEPVLFAPHSLAWLSMGHQCTGNAQTMPPHRGSPHCGRWFIFISNYIGRGENVTRSPGVEAVALSNHNEAQSERTFLVSLDTSQVVHCSVYSHPD